MTPEEKLENKAWEILQKIKEEILFQGTLSIIWKQPQKSSQNSFSFEFNYEKGEEVILGKFEEKGVLKITTKKSSLPSLPLSLHPSLPKNTFDYDNELYLNILQPKFDKVYKKFEERHFERSSNKKMREDENFNKNSVRRAAQSLLDKLNIKEEIKRELREENIEKIQGKDRKNKIDKSTDKNLKSEITVGKLIAYEDGTIRYGNEIIKLRSQINDLCRQFMKKPDRLITIDDIKDNIIKASKRESIEYQTIAKYISELHKSLKIHFKKNVIFNQKKEGWYFKPPK